ncbi:MarR family transcriptional regulator [Acetobacterium wieringae]|uniref:HTH-type transcriptional regulator MhqR n=1 Tax=Acetobacterium wieringae TaxID=52694 RepID=A0A1F2PGR1_9FIRM|nr:MarR family transcriptional regulator [Acetobacterium wieringae]OFV70508.1 HTH-type transcriptional regulator MhqR [Acetobacterium wieringae]URN85577.1 MarR family transcriptional regulator [Acetobacterium wieringae]
MKNRLNGNLETLIFEYLDKIKYLLSPEIWGNEIFNCSKNEVFVLMLLYRRSDVNMTQIADYLSVPLNTATGIVARMEKREVVLRERSSEDKRVVTIKLTEVGRVSIQNILTEMIRFGQLIMDSFTSEEVNLVFKLVDKVIDTINQDTGATVETQTSSKIRKIIIE